jgi:NAD(P)H-hydrate repair Nnr-like enzyme with NAD(P)H-hydrate dehydratase domain
MMLIVGTVPTEDLPVITGEVKEDGDSLVIDGHRIPCMQGTAAMIGASLAAANYMKIDAPHALVAGDVGVGNGSRAIFQYIAERIDKMAPKLLVLHYCLPVVGLFKRAFEAINKMNPKPYLIADAGAMYAAKALGIAPQFDVFTPDFSELAYLADPNATHPAYVAKYLFESNSSQIPSMIETAYKNHSAPRLLVAKGSTDYIAQDGLVVATVSEPNVPMLEPIGGTGDTITGLLSTFIYSGMKPVEAAIMAAKVNRLAGQIGQVNPETKVGELVGYFKDVFPKLL